MMRYRSGKSEMMVRKALNLLLMMLVSLGCLATDPDTSEVVVLKDDPVLMALDNMLMAKYFEASDFTTDVKLLNKGKWKEDEVPVFDEAHYRKALAALDRNTPFDLVYNEPVRAYINAYLGRNREKVSRLLGLSELYFPLFEEMLDRYDLPMELKYLAIIESALNPNAQSTSGATGLWQFMYRTGKIYNLDVTSYVDDRCDPYRSTQAACEYFRFLYDMFGDWQMVLAAYNGGPGTLMKAIRRSGGKRNYWEVRPYLSKETQSYVPAFIAVNYVMNHAAENNVYPVKPKFLSYELDTVVVRKHTNLTTLAAVLKIPYEEVQFLNPIFKQPVIPASDEGYSLILPKEKIGLFLSNQAAIYQHGAPKVNEAYAKQEDIMKEVRKTHKVKSGETLSGIAARYRVNVNDLREWNNIKGNLIRVGQELVIHARSASPEASTTTSVSPTPPVGEPKYHVVKAGDTLWEIAKRNNISIVELKEMNDIRDGYVLKIGAKLRVG